jgi:NAD(P)-dependent dehydrogenase (short-subunit alcohol dehydrogenase family)
MRPVCLITGAGGRLGSALCRDLLATHDVAAVYRNQLPSVPSQFSIPIIPGSSAGEPAGAAFCIQGDLTVRADLRRIVEVTMARFGRIDVLIQAAADTRYHGRLLELSFDSAPVEHQMLANCVAPIALASAIFQQFWKNERQSNRASNRVVIHVSSISGLYVFPGAGQGFYSASKAALNFLTAHLAWELADYSVRVNAICPSRFPDSIPVTKVVAAVRNLIDSDITGEIVEITSHTP